MSSAISSNSNQESQYPHYYFAYGSNLSYEFMKERLKDGEWTDGWHKTGEIQGPIPVDLGNYLLQDYQFGYNLDTTPFGEPGTAGHIYPKEGSKVYGVLYKISQLHLDELDKSEDAPENYIRVAVKVQKLGSSTFKNNEKTEEPVTAWVYVGNSKYMIDKVDVDPVYVQLLVESATKRGFPEEYIKSHLELNQEVLAH